MLLDDALRELCVSALREAAYATELVYREKLDNLQAVTQIKADASPVTVADFVAQAIIIFRLKNGAKTSTLHILAEESIESLETQENDPVAREVDAYLCRILADSGYESLKDCYAPANNSSQENGESLFFTLDPIDGTKGYLRGGQYAICLALISLQRENQNTKNEVVFSVMACPRYEWKDHVGLIASAIKGENSIHIETIGPNLKRWTLPEATITAATPELAPLRVVESLEAKTRPGHVDIWSEAVSHSEKNKKPLLDGAERVRMDSQAKYLAVALDDADVYLRYSAHDYRENIWDHASGALLVAESGGVVTDLQNAKLDWSCGEKLQNNVGILCTKGRGTTIARDAILQVFC